MSPKDKPQRANKSEALAAREVLKAVWEKAFREGSVLISYPEEEPQESKTKAEALHNALSTNRKYIRKNKADCWELFLKMNSCSLFRRGKYAVEVKRKPAKHSNRSSIVLDLINQIPDLGIQEDKNSIDSIMKEFKDMH